MIQLFFIFLFSLNQNSFASTAAVKSLQSNHINNDEYAYLFPTKLLELPDQIVFKTGSNTATDSSSRPSAWIKSTLTDKYVIGLTLGRQSDLVDFSRQLSNTNMLSNFDYTANSININYATLDQGQSYSLGFFYADKNDKYNQIGNHAGTINLGFRMDDFSFGAVIGLYNTVETNLLKRLAINQSFTGSMAYELDDILFLLDLSSSHARQFNLAIQPNAQTDDFEFLNYKMGIVKNIYNGHELLFYRINLETDQLKNRQSLKSMKTVKLPLTIGFQSDLNESLTIRSSIRQTIGVSQSDDVPAGLNTTIAAVGVAINFNQLVVDGLMQGLVGPAASQQINQNQFLSEISVTYLFN